MELKEQEWVMDALLQLEDWTWLLNLVRDARPTQTYSFLPASWAGDAHEETDFLPIGDREEKER